MPEATYDLNKFQRNADGTLAEYAWPGGYPLYYLSRDGCVLCPKCANEPNTSDPVVAVDINYEDPTLICEDAGERIQSAYAEDDPAVAEHIEAQR